MFENYDIEVKVRVGAVEYTYSYEGAEVVESGPFIKFIVGDEEHWFQKNTVIKVDLRPAGQ